MINPHELHQQFLGTLSTTAETLALIQAVVTRAQAPNAVRCQNAVRMFHEIEILVASLAKHVTGRRLDIHQWKQPEIEHLHDILATIESVPNHD